MKVDGVPNAVTTAVGQQDKLAGCRIISVETYSIIDTTTDPNYPQNTIITNAQLTALALTLFRVDASPTNSPGEWYANIPLTKLRMMVNNNASLSDLPSASRNPFVIYPSLIDWAKTKVIAPPGLSMTANTSVIFGVYYFNKGETGLDYYNWLTTGMKK
jgi:hypothetical protein